MFATSEGGLWRMAGKARTKVWAIFEEKTHAPAHFCSVPSSFWPLGDFDNPIYSFPNLPSGHQTWHSYGKGFVEYFIPIILMVVFHSNLFDYQRIHVHFEITRVCIKYNKYSYRNCIQALWRLWTCYRSKKSTAPPSVHHPATSLPKAECTCLWKVPWGIGNHILPGFNGSQWDLDQKQWFNKW